ncbi:hypothetical protein C8Q75DRAFT_724568 [Abortiporus biennis]|nr:hypothetical protein C8Q75DRAFT_724568 [Abortiporus biennis]
MSVQSKQIAIPRPSASLVIVNSSNEILLVERNPKAGSFAGASVFPGGNFDPKQDSSLGITAIRETFEETGLLFTFESGDSGSSLWPTNSELDTARAEVHSQKLTFNDFLSKHKLRPDTSSLLPFTQWVTPANQPRRFRTQFYLTFFRDSPSHNSSDGVGERRLPTPDGGQEVIRTRWVSPSSVLNEVRDRKISLFPPQFYILTTLAGILNSNTRTLDQENTVKTLSKTAFGRMVINPIPLKQKDEKGRLVLTYEGDETRGGPQGQLHRMLVNFEKGGYSFPEELQRNFDIFNDVGKFEHLFEPIDDPLFNAKL